MPARPCLFVACAPSGSRIHPPYVKLFRKNCPAESTRIVERPKNQGPEQLRKQAVRDMEVSPATGIANRREVLGSSQLEAVVDGRTSHGRRGGDREQARLLLLLRNDARGLAVGFRELVVDIAAAHHTGDQFSAKKGIIWWHRSQDVGVHHVDKPFPPRLHVPAD